MVLYGKFLELHDLYNGLPLLLRADLIQEVHVITDHTDEVVYVSYAGANNYFLVEEDYETVRGLPGQVYSHAKKG